MGELLVKHLLHVGCSDITVINRSYDRGKVIAQRRGIKAASWNELSENISGADIVVSSVSAQEYLFDKPAFQKIMETRPDKSLLVIDISVPRNFEPDVEQIKNVHLYSIDELSEQARENLKDARR